MAIVFSKASGLNDTMFGKSQEPIKMLLDHEVDAFKEMSAIPKLFKTINSTNYAEKIASRTTMGDFERVAEGGAYPMDDMQDGFAKVLEPYTWKKSFAITKEMIEDNKLLDMEASAMGFTDAYNRTRERYAAAMLAGGVKAKTTFNGKVYDTTSADGVSLFNKAHPSAIKGGKTQSNLFADAFSKDMLGAMETAMQNFMDDNGNVLNVAPDTIIIPNDYRLKNAVFEVIGSDKDPSTSNNGFNYQYGRWNVIVWPYLTVVEGAEAPFILVDSKYNMSRVGGAIVERVPLSVHSYVDENNDNNVWNGRARFGIGFNNWRAFAIGGVTGGTTLVG